MNASGQPEFRPISRSIRRSAAWFRFLAAACSIMPSSIAAEPAPPDVPAAAAHAAGVQILNGAQVRLLTDAASSPPVDELPSVFDAAVPLWAVYFDLREDAAKGLRWQAYLMVDRVPFEKLGLLPLENLEFANGYARGLQFWFMDQPTDYYRRHLLLHEGTHSWMQTVLGGCGAGWYMEGMAELLATHEWKNGKLRLAAFPSSRDDVPMWGRIKIVRDGAAANRAWSVEKVLAIDNTRPMTSEHYAWSWALCAMLEGTPRFQPRFRKLKDHVRDVRFNARFRDLFAADWDDLQTEWLAFISTIDYGFDFSRMALVHTDLADVAVAASTNAPIQILADRGWQSTGLLFRAGEEYEITASGRYQIARDADGKPWPCEPGGVTIEYFHGRPLGALLGALDSGDEVEPQHETPTFARPALLGLHATIRPARDGILYLRVNDSSAKLDDNSGQISVTVKKLSGR